MILDPEDVNVRAATLGRIVEDFKSSPVGSYIVERAIRQGMAASEKLKHVDAANVDQVRTLQLEARVADSIITWLEEAIRVGHSALDQLREDEYAG